MSLQNTLGTALAAACEKFAGAAALCAGDRTLTYADLAREAKAVSEALGAAELERNEPVHVSVSNHPLDLAALLGVWQAGGVAVPVHRSMPEGVAAKVAKKTQARYLADLRSSRQNATTMVATIAAAPPPSRRLLDGAAFIIFTSGSTGTPKGVVVSHRAFHGKIEQIDSLLGFQAAERTLLVLNITFSFGLWVSLLTLLRGGTLVMQEKFEPEAFLQALTEERIARVGMVPTMMRVLFSNPAMRSKIERLAGQRSLRQIMIGGESLGRSLAETIRQSFAGTQLIDIYGLTETATCDFFAFPDDYAKYPGCIGKASPNVTFRIVDESGVAVESNGVGELQIHSPYLMNGYLDEPELTAAAFTGAWFRTGDLARRLDEDVVELMGRKKEVISRGGNKVTPVEIEQLICSHADVAAAMAVGMADAVLGERIHVLMVPRSGVSLDIASLKKFFENKLEKFKQPDFYYVANELPLGRTGKADRGQLQFLIESGRVTSLSA